MAIYRNFFIDLWDEDDILCMTADETYLYMYLRTNPKGTSWGIYKISFRLVEFHLKLSHERVIEAFEGLIKKGKITYDKATKEIGICDWFTHNFQSSPKYIRSIEKGFQNVDSQNLKDQFKDIINKINEYEDTIDSGQIVNSTHSDTDSVSSKVNDYSINNSSIIRSSTDIEDNEKDKENYTLIAETWNKKMENTHISKVKYPFSALRNKLLKEIIRENGIELVLEMIDKVSKSDFANGKNDKKWVISFSWCIQNSENFAKIIEGNFDYKDLRSKEQIANSKKYANRD